MSRSGWTGVVHMVTWRSRRECEAGEAREGEEWWGEGDQKP